MDIKHDTAAVPVAAAHALVQTQLKGFFGGRTNVGAVTNPASAIAARFPGLKLKTAFGPVGPPLIGGLGSTTSGAGTNGTSEGQTETRTVPDLPLPGQLVRTQSSGIHLDPSAVAAQHSAKPSQTQSETQTSSVVGSGDSVKPSVPSHQPQQVRSPEELRALQQTPQPITSQTTPTKYTEDSKEFITKEELQLLLSSLRNRPSATPSGSVQSTPDLDITKKRKVGWHPSASDVRGVPAVISNGMVVSGDPSAVMEEGIGEADEGSDGEELGDEDSVGMAADGDEELFEALAVIAAKVDIIGKAVVAMEGATKALVDRQNSLFDYLTRIAKSGRSP